MTIDEDKRIRVNSIPPAPSHSYKMTAILSHSERSLCMYPALFKNLLLNPTAKTTRLISPISSNPLKLYLLGYCSITKPKAREHYTFGALAATLAASVYCMAPNKVLNFLTNNSSAPARLFLTAKRRARSGFCSTLVIYGMILSSSTLTDSTCQQEWEISDLEVSSHKPQATSYKLQSLHC